MTDASTWSFFRIALLVTGDVEAIRHPKREL